MKIINEPKVGSTFDSKEINAIKKVLMSGDNLTRGKDVDLFEKEFAKIQEIMFQASFDPFVELE